MFSGPHGKSKEKTALKMGDKVVQIYQQNIISTWNNIKKHEVPIFNLLSYGTPIYLIFGVIVIVRQAKWPHTTPDPPQLQRAKSLVQRQYGAEETVLLSVANMWF